MALTTEGANALLNLLLNNQAWANVGDAGGLQPSSANGNLYLSLHTASPGVSGTQATSETAYTTYARAAAARDNTIWTVASATAENPGAITWHICGATGSTCTHVGLGTASSGAGHLIAYAQLSAPLVITNGKTPTVAINGLIWTAS